MKKLPKVKNKTYKNKCDTIWSQIIRAYGRCEKCGKGGRLEAAHIVSRRYSATRHLLDNGLCLCTGCHFWAHHNPTKFTRWVDSYLGESTVKDLEKKSDERLDSIDYKEIYLFLKDISEKL